MSLKEELLSLTTESKLDKYELAKQELVILCELLVKTMKDDANRGLYATKLTVNKVTFPNVMYKYAETKELFVPGSGMMVLRKDLAEILDSSLVFQTKTDGDVINISTYWG